MKIDLQKVISVYKYKNGNIKVHHTLENEGNIYEYLNTVGFSETRINGKRVYLKHLQKEREKEEISFEEIKHYFWTLLQKEYYFNIPKDVSKEDILNWFLKNNPIRQNNIFEYYMFKSSRFRHN